MRPSLWFVVPAHGRLELSAVCLRVLAATCRQLVGMGVDATACVIADDGNIDLARKHGFATVERNNQFLGRRFNDGFEFAAAEGAGYVVPCGSDDWVHPDLIFDWVEAHQRDRAAGSTVVVTRDAAAVAPGGRELARLRIPYDGGIGVRLIPTEMIGRLNWRPADEERARGIDGNIAERLHAAGPFGFRYLDRGPLEIVDFKLGGPQLNPFETILGYATEIDDDPWAALATRWPRVHVNAMRKLYSAVAA